MDKKRVYITSAVAGVLGGLFINLLSEAVKHLIDRAWGKPLDRSQLTIIWVVITLVLGAMLWAIFSYLITDEIFERVIKLLRPQFFSKLKATVESTIYMELLKALEGKTGIVRVHNSMKDALGNMKSCIAETRDLKILSNKGTDWIGDDNAALSEIISKRAAGSLKLRILLLSKDAPWLDAGWAKERGKPSLQYVKSEFETAHRLVESFFEKQNNLKHKSAVRYHRDDPVWRLIITDDRAFISSYASADQARDGVVLELKGPNTDLYQAYKRYFNFLWHRRGMAKDIVEESAAENIKYDNFELSSGGVVYTKIAGERRILILQRLKEDGGLYTLPKGHLKKQERPSEAALREIIEETGLEKNKLKIITGLGWYPNPILIGDKARVFKIVYYYLIRYEGNGLPPLEVDPDHESARWVLLDDIKSLTFAYSHIERVLFEAMSNIE